RSASGAYPDWYPTLNQAWKRSIHENLEDLRYPADGRHRLWLGGRVRAAGCRATTAGGEGHLDRRGRHGQGTEAEGVAVCRRQASPVLAGTARPGERARR